MSLFAIPQSLDGFTDIRRDIVELSNRYRIKTLAADMVHAYQLGQELSEQDGINVEWFRQGFISMGPPTSRLEKLVLEKQICFGDNPVLRWAAGNVAVEQDAAGNIKCSKRRSMERIDPVISLVQAIGVDMANVETESVYEE